MSDPSNAPEARDSTPADRETPSTPAPTAADRRRRRLFYVFMLVPTAMLVVSTEIVVRLSGLDQAKLQTPFLMQEDDPVHRHDPQLFFAMRPNVDVAMQGVQVSINSDGLRSAELGPKRTGEFRILSLGESSTFGAFVEREETYSAQLEKHLREADDRRTWRVVNAGVSAYSSFQSLKFLELRGLELEPDMVLFYHEINDFLPATIRGGDSQDERGLALSDRELYESKQQSLHRRLLSLSAVYRVLHYHQLRRRLQGRSPVPADDNSVLIPPNFYLVKSREGARMMNLATRVPAAERKQILSELKSVCDKYDVRLVVIHPSYRDSRRHKCELTEFCRQAQVPMFESYDALHPEGSSPEDFFIDLWHPSPAGHAAIGRGLAEFLPSVGLLAPQE